METALQGERDSWIASVRSAIRSLLAIQNQDLHHADGESHDWIKEAITHASHLEDSLIDDRPLDKRSVQFFTADSTVLKQLRDWGLDEVANIYSE